MSIIGSGEVRIGASAVGLQSAVNAHLRKIRAKLDVKLGVDTKAAEAHIKAFTHKPRRNIQIGVTVNDNDLRKLDNNLRRVEHTFKRSALSKAIRIQVVVAGAAALPALAQGALSAAAALTALGQAALVLPGIFSGFAATIGTVITGMRGLGTAFSAAGKGASQAARNTDEYQKASRDLARAQRDMVQAVKDANREIQDQQDKLAQGTLNVEQAQINVRKAQERLAKGGFDSVTDWQQANLDLKQSYIDLHEATQGYGRDMEDYVSKADKSAAGTDTWRDAVDKLASATEQFSEAQNKANGITDEFIQAMKELSPAGQDFVNKVLQIKGAWSQLEDAVSDKLLVGLGDSIVNLANKRLPMLQAGMEKIATSMNGLFKSALDNIGSERNARFLSLIFENTATAIDKMTPGFNSFVNGFLQLSEVGSRFLPRLGEAFSDVMGRFERFISRADADGSLERWIDRGLLVIGKLGESIGHIGSILESVTTAYEAATGNIGGFATTMEAGLGKLANWLKSAEGQASLIGYLKDAGLFLQTIKDAMPGIIDAFKTFGDAARAVAEVVFPIFSAIGRWAQEHKALVETLIKLYLLWVTVKPAIQAMSNLHDKVTQAAERQRRKVLDLQAAYDKSEARLDRMVRAEEAAAQRVVDAQDRVRAAKEEAAKANWNVAATNAEVTGANGRADRGVSLAAIELDRARSSEVMAANVLESARREATLMSTAGSVRNEYTAAALDSARRQLDIMSDVGELQRLRDDKYAAEGRVSQLNASGKLPGADAELARQRALATAMGDYERLTNALNTFEREREIASAQFTEAFERDQAAQAAAQADFESKREASLARLSDAEAAHQAALADTDSKTRQVADAEDHRYRTQQDGIRKANQAMADAQSGAATYATAQDGVAAAQRDLDTATKNVATATADLDRQAEKTAKGGVGLLRGAIGDAKTGLIGGIKSLVGFIGPTLAVGGALYALDLWIQYNRDAAEAAERHKNRVDELANSLSSATGAATEASKQGIVDRLSNAENTDTKEKYGDLLKVAEENGIDTNKLANALNTGDTATVNSLLAPIREKARAGLLSSESAKTALRGRDNLTEDQLFQAMTGDQGSIDQFGRDSGLRYTLDRLGILETHDLGDVQKGLDPETQRLFQLLQITGDVQRDRGPAIEQQQRENRANYGESQFIPGAPNPFGPQATVSPTEGGRQVVTVPKSFADANPGLLQNVIDKGGQVFETAQGTVELTLMPDRAKNYIQPLTRASGGPVFGAGTATSDSIPAMLSNGEFVINAKSAAKIGAPMLHALNQGVLGFKTGGPVIRPNMPGIPFPVAPIPVAPQQATGANPALAGLTPRQVLNVGAGAPIPNRPVVGPGARPGVPAPVASNTRAWYDAYKKPPVAAPKPAPGAGTPVVPKKPVAAPTPTVHTGSGLGPGPSAHSGSGYTPGPISASPSVPVPMTPAAGLPVTPGATMPIIPGQGRTGPEAGLQANTLRAKRAIEAAFPEIQTIGGVRPDALHWHPDGLALDVMIPNPGSAEGYALGDRIWEWAKANPQYGFQFNGESIWRDGGAHEDHLHLTTNGGGMPTGGETFNLPGVPGMPGLPAAGGPAGAVPPFIAGLGNPLDPNGSGPFGGLLGNIGQIILQAIGGFFGIDLSGIFNMINGIANGAGGMFGGAGQTPQANIPVTDYSQSISDLKSQAQAARAQGNNVLADQLDKTAQDLAQQSSATNAAVGSVTRDSAPGDIAKYIYNQAIARGYSPSDARMIVAQAKGESSFNPTISGGRQGDDEVIGIFQEKTAFSGGLSVEDRKDPVKNIEAYFNQLQAHGGPGQEIVDLLARTSVGGPAHPANGGRAYIQQLAAQLADPQFLGFSKGGHVKGPGTGISDSIPAYLSNGEFVMKADAVRKYGGGFMSALNSGGVPGFNGGGIAGGWLKPTQPVQFNPQQQEMLQPQSYAPDPMAQQAGAALGSLGAGITAPKGTAGGGGGAPSGWNPAASNARGEAAGDDARGAFAAATNNQNHLNPAFKSAIKGGFSTVGSIASQAASMAVSAGSMGAGAAGGAQAAGQLTGAAFEIAGDVATGAANILSSLAVGTASPTTGGGYGAPLLPQSQVKGQGSNFQTINNGDVYTNNLDEYSRLQNRQEAQRSLPLMNRL